MEVRLEITTQPGGVQRSEILEDGGPPSPRSRNAAAIGDLMYWGVRRAVLAGVPPASYTVEGATPQDPYGTRVLITIPMDASQVVIDAGPLHPDAAKQAVDDFNRRAGDDHVRPAPAPAA